MRNENGKRNENYLKWIWSNETGVEAWQWLNEYSLVVGSPRTIQRF